MALTGMSTTGCGSRSYLVTSTSDAPVVSKSPDCDFDILTAPAGGEYEEVATLETEGQPAVTAAEFQKVVGKQVCELGGDVVIAEISSQGAYLRGTVLRAKEVTPLQAAVDESTSGDSAAPPAAP